jgi:hypothetical protein
MPLNTTSLLLYFLASVLIYLTYIAHNIKNKIWCSYRRPDRTKIERWVAIGKDGRWSDVEFDGGWYHVEPSRTVLMWKVFLGFFPMPIRCLDFRHDSARALDPSTFQNSIDAQMRKDLDKTDELRAIFKASSEQAANIKKRRGGMFEGYTPIILLIGFVVLGWFMYQMIGKLDMIGNGQNLVESQLNVLQQMIQSIVGQ